MIKKPIVLYTDHEINRILCYSFAKGSGSLMCHVNNFSEFDKTIATYGYLRGTGEAIKKVKNYFYIDHGYFKQSKRKFIKNKVVNMDLDGYFRIVYNDYWSDGSKKKSSDRFNKLSLEIKDKKSTGDYIIISEPIPEAIDFYNLGNWTEVTISKLKKYTDRKLIIHSRSSEIRLDDLLKNAWAFVSDHSSAGFKAMMEGVPAYFTNSTLGKISSIDKIEDHEIDYSVFYNLAYEQWSITEIQNGEAWDYLSQRIK